MTCVRSSRKKYISRPSPSFPAQSCAGTTKRGNDGAMWISKPTSTGVYRWVPLVPKKQLSRRSRKRSTKKSSKAKLKLRSPTKSKRSKSDCKTRIISAGKVPASAVDFMVSRYNKTHKPSKVEYLGGGKFKLTKCKADKTDDDYYELLKIW